ncbi:hypothetical protein DFQ27_004124 [Actinomortierella ambigua]|uniref:Transmembrane protein n=1 Tax=Actinomortierella ambigua TaxID=1343610 RepID=A0A9P6Q6V3_9FUNG|nr:hypothetical protein DFQ27_004124 [Actinomortierella ambigua]
MENIDSPYDDWSQHIHAVITILKPYFDDWRSYVSLTSTMLGIGILVMENQVLLRMRMGRLEILGYIISLLPAPVAKNYTIMGAVCVTATVLTLISNVLYMLRGWQEPLPFYDRASGAIRWMTSQIWYAIGMIFLFHVVTRPAQSGVVLFGKFPRDLWAFKWHLCILYVPVNYLLLELCDVHRENAKILIPLEILVDICLYNGPFLIVLLRLLYLAWKVAYDEAVLTGAIFEDEEAGVESPIPGLFRGGRSTRVSSGPSTRSARNGSGRPGGGDYVGLAMVDIDEAEHTDGATATRSEQSSSSAHKGKDSDGEDGIADSTTIYVLDDETDFNEVDFNENEQRKTKSGSLSSNTKGSSPVSSSTSPRMSRSASRGGRSPHRTESPPANLAVSTSPSALTPRSTSPSGYRSPKSTTPSPSSYTSRGSPLRNVAYSSTFEDPSSTEEEDDEDGRGDGQASKALFSN